MPLSFILGILGVGALIVGACALPAPNSPPPTAAAGCPQEVADRGEGWKEAGGPRAFVLAEYPFIAHPVYPRKVFVRFEKGLDPPFAIEGRLVAGDLSQQGDFLGHGPPTDLSGSVHLVGLLLSRPGCWEVTLSAESEVAGTAWIEVQERSEQAPTPATGSAAPP